MVNLPPKLSKIKEKNAIILDRSYWKENLGRYCTAFFSILTHLKQANTPCHPTKVASLSIINCDSKFFKCWLKNSLGVGEFELDECYFGARRISVKRGRGAAGKTPAFGLIKKYGAYVEIVKNCPKEQIIPIIKGLILEGSMIHAGGRQVSR